MKQVLYEPIKKMIKESVLNSATESSCHHSFFEYLAKHLYEVTRNETMNKTIVVSRGRPSVSDWPSGIISLHQVSAMAIVPMIGRSLGANSKRQPTLGGDEGPRRINGERGGGRYGV